MLSSGMRLNATWSVKEICHFVDSFWGASLSSAQRPFIKGNSPACFAVNPVLVGDATLIGTNVDEAEIMSQTPTAQQQAVCKPHQNVAQLQSDSSMMGCVQTARKRQLDHLVL